MAYKGIYSIQNPDKYAGDPRKCIFRSLWERKLCKYFDFHPDVLEWCIEPFPIKYLSPVDGRKHNYWIDFIVKFRTKSGKTRTMLIEVKPKKQTKQPEKKLTPKTKCPTQQFIREATTYAINKSKWTAAEALAKSRGWEFKIMTEDDILHG